MNEPSQPQAADFFTAGGTLRADAPSYVPRQADEDLFHALARGEFCYVLTSRQMGKSSLMVRTAMRLTEDDATVVALDLTSYGQNVTPEQWYYSLLTTVGQRLDLEDELDDFWEDNDSLTPLYRWMEAFRQVVLGHTDGDVVVFIDEIDVVQSLPFSTNEFFAGIRECYTRRSQFPDLERLTFCLIGVATPSDLIDDVRVTPFNIGHRVELSDFTNDEAQQLTAGLGRDDSVAADLMPRVQHWTGGHPYLTQRLSQAVAEDDSVTDSTGVDRICAELFFSERAQEQDSNLQFVRNQMLGRSDVDPASLLTLYRDVRAGKSVPHDETNPLVNVLQLSGIAGGVGGYMRVRNRIYEHVFRAEWVRENMPGTELRRQRRAFWRGTLTAAGLSLAVLTIVGVSLLMALQSLDDVRTAQTKLQADDGVHRLRSGDASGLLDIARALDATDDPDTQRLVALQWAHWEAGYRSRLLDILHFPSPMQVGSFTSDGAFLVTLLDDGRLLRWEKTEVGWSASRLPSDVSVDEFWLPSEGHTILTRDAAARLATWDAQTLSAVTVLPADVILAVMSANATLVATSGAEQAVSVTDTVSGVTVSGPWPHVKPSKVLRLQFTSDDSILHIVTLDDEEGHPAVRIESRHLASGELAREPVIIAGATSFEDRMLTDKAWRWGWQAEEGKWYQVRDPVSLAEVTPPRPYESVHGYTYRSTPLRTHPQHALAEALWRRLDDGRLIGEVIDANGDPWIPHTMDQGLRIVGIGSRRGLVATSNVDRERAAVEVSSLISGEIIARLPIPGRIVEHHGEGLQFGADDQLLVAQQRGTLLVWDLESGTQILPPLAHPQFVASRTFRPNRQSELLALADDRFAAYLWRMGTQTRLAAQSYAPSQPAEPRKSGYGRVIWSPDGLHVAVTVKEQHNDPAAVHVRLWHWLGGELSEASSPGEYMPGGPVGGGLPVAFTRDSLHLAYPGGDGKSIGFWPTSPQSRARGPVATFAPNPTLGQGGIVFTSDGSRLLLAGLSWHPDDSAAGFAFGGFMDVIDTDSREALPGPIDSGTMIGGRPTSIAASADGLWVATTHTDGRTQAWDPRDLSDPVATFGHSRYANKLSFSADSRFLITASDDATARVWRVGEWTLDGDPIQHDTQVWDAEFSPDGTLIATATRDGSVQLWDFISREAVGPALHHESPAFDVSFHPSGKWLATVSRQGHLRVWTVPTPPTEHDGVERRTWRSLGMRHDEFSDRLRSLTAEEWAGVRSL